MSLLKSVVKQVAENKVCRSCCWLSAALYARQFFLGTSQGLNAVLIVYKLLTAEIPE